MAMVTRLLRDVYRSHGDYGSIGLDRYPLFNESHRNDLNQKIVQHYAMREIAFDTDDMFIFELRAKMNEIMPPYNELYMSAALKYDILSTTDLTASTQSTMSGDSTTETTSTSDTDNTSTGRGVQSEPPASELSADGQYATGISDSQSASTMKQSAGNSGNSSESRKASGASRTLGRTTAGSALVQAFRDTIVNVDMLIVNDLEELFMQILSSDDDDFASLGYYPYSAAFPFYPYGV